MDRYLNEILLEEIENFINNGVNVFSFKLSISNMDEFFENFEKIQLVESLDGIVDSLDIKLKTTDIKAEEILKYFSTMPNTFISLNLDEELLESLSLEELFNWYNDYIKFFVNSPYETFPSNLVLLFYPEMLNEEKPQEFLRKFFGIEGIYIDYKKLNDLINQLKKHLDSELMDIINQQLASKEEQR